MRTDKASQPSILQHREERAICSIKLLPWKNPGMDPWKIYSRQPLPYTCKSLMTQHKVATSRHIIVTLIVEPRLPVQFSCVFMF